ncbi:MAG: MFS transporter [Burkholderiaceae bacterium]
MKQPLSDRAVTVYCGLLMAITAFSIDITLPFFSQIRESLQTTNELVTATITVNIFCLGIGQLFFGPLSDRYGRRPAVCLGLSIYLAGTLAAIFATDISALLTGRALQGLGAGAAPVVARAVIRDRFTGTAMAQNMALASGIFSVGPIVAPLIGAALIELGGNWQIIFAAMMLMAAALLVALLKIPETLATPNPSALNPATVASNIQAIFKHPQSRYFLLLSAWTMVSLVIIISGTASVMEHEFGVTGTLFALLFAAHGLGIVVGQFCNHWLIGRFGTVRASICGALVMTSAMSVTVVLAWFGHLNAYGLAALVVLFAVGYLPVYSNTASLTLDPHGKIAGFTAAFYGAFGQLSSAAIATGLVALAGGRLVPWSATLAFVCAVSFIALWAWLRREAPVIASAYSGSPRA